MHVPLQPLAPSESKPLIKVRKGPGCFSFLLLLIVAGAGAFGYAMYRWQESPEQVWNRLTTVVRHFVQEQFPAPTPSPEETPTATPAPARPDPITWLIEHKQYWPNQVALREPLEFPAVSRGKAVGSLVVPAGATVKVKDIAGKEIAADFMGGARRIPIAATDLPARAEAALRKSENEAKQGRGTTARVAPSPVPEIAREQAAEKIREATPEEIGKGLGALYTHGATTFRIFAPAAKTVGVVLYNEASGNNGRTVRPLRQQLNGLWDAAVPGDWRGKFYTYLLDENDPKHAREVLDPYAVNAVASSSRGRITPMTDPVPRGPKLESPTDAVIYEMHVRDLTIDPNSGVKNAGLYLGFTEQGTRLSANSGPDETGFRQWGTARQGGAFVRADERAREKGGMEAAPPSQIKTALDHLSELGVTHLELMPVEDFENDETSGAYNWGYITTDFFSPEGMFATDPNDDSRVRELKALVAALHRRGMGVIMDVVYNHTSGNASLLSIGPDYYYRRGSNGGLANGSGCGNEVKSEAPMARRLILDSLKYWVKEYGIDGFRFDLMALIDRETLREADRELKKINPSIILFGEPWTGGASPLQQKTDKGAIRQMPVGAFNDDFRNALKGSPDGNDPGWIENGSKRDALKGAMLLSDWFESPGQSINYMTCHDNLVLWDKLAVSMPNADDGLRLETMKLGFLALFTSQGVPFMLGGGEFARTKGGNSNSFEAPDSVNEIDWALKREHLDLFKYVRDLIGLRKAHPMFRLRTRPEVQSRVQFLNTPDRDTLMFTINGKGVPGEKWKRVCVVLNSANEADAAINLPPGDWMMALDEGGAPAVDTTTATSASGKIRVRHKSGVVLYQQ